MQVMPVLKRSAALRQLPKDLLEVDYLGHTYTLQGKMASLLANIAHLLGGDKDIAAIASLSKADRHEVSALVNALNKYDLVSWARDPLELMSGPEFYKYHRRYCRHWLREIYDHPFWDKVVSGTATDAQVIGFAFEKYHYIEGAHEHMGIAAANASREMMPHLARHFAEEYTHGDIYRRGLAALFDDSVVLNSQPLPSTRALVNFLNEAAASDSLAYYAANEFLQMTENDEDAAGKGSGAVSEFYKKMIENYPYTKPLVDSFIQHTALDQKLGHEGAFSEMCQDVPPLTREQVGEIMDTTRSVVDVLKLFMDGIDVFYEEFPEMPRMPATLLSE